MAVQEAVWADAETGDVWIGGKERAVHISIEGGKISAEYQEGWKEWLTDLGHPQFLHLVEEWQKKLAAAPESSKGAGKGAGKTAGKGKAGSRDGAWNR